ncbi:brevican core protein-like [Neoarius graeffei]|uniref:brevican core protein-like n=1 Tax=Neoarius graeffei TaxID=443677 RepID=UPI00298C0F56|nr:brevican core protein-like [Neoarius graeffei]
MEQHLFIILYFADRYTGSDSYISIPSTMTWHEAQSYCRQHHTDLASARNQTEQSFIQGKIPQFSWIGLFRDSWKSVDGTNISRITWMPGTPDNALGNENCGYAFQNQVGDAQCSYVWPFFCYSIITGKIQYIKLQLISGQDLLDPAVQVTILEKIKQKLLDHGMGENTTVKWRTQPDGLVFHKETERTQF